MSSDNPYLSRAPPLLRGTSNGSVRRARRCQAPSRYNRRVAEQSELLVNVSIALGVALAGGWLATRLRLSPIVGYLVAGVVISPFTPGFVADVDALRLLADVGVVLLLFAIGVQLSLRDLTGVGRRIALTATAQIVLVIGCVWAIGASLGWSQNEALYAGAAAAISSSAVLIKILEARGDLASEHGGAAVAWAIVQDLWAVVLIAVLGTLAGSGDGSGVSLDVGIAAAKAIAFVLTVLIVGLRVIPWVLNLVAEERSRELFFVSIAFLAIGTALMSEYAGLSLALGAFLAGIIVSESDLSHRVLSELLPTRDVFAVLFFVSTGMLIDPAVVRSEWVAVLATTFGISLAKPIISVVLFALSGARMAVAVLTAAVLLPAGEFSFLLARSGLAEGGISEGFFGAILAATVLSIVVSPGIVEGAYRWVERDRGRLPAEPAEEHPTSRLGRRAIVCGYSRVGQVVSSILSPRFEVWVVEEDRTLSRVARRKGLNVIEGSPTSHAVLERMHLPEARVLILTMRDSFSARLAAERARDINPHLEVVGLASVLGDVEKLRKSGVRVSVVAEDEGAYELARYGLHRFGVASNQAAAIVQHARSTYSR